MTAAPKPEIGTTTDRQPGLSVAPRPSTVALIRPAASPLALLELHKEIATVVGSILVAGTDYGVIPGTGDKPALLKPGAERVCFAFGCAPKYEVVDRQIEHDREVKWTKRKKKWRNANRGDREFTWEEESGTSLGLYRYEVRCSLVRREDGAAVAEGMASCSTMESKYIDRPRDTENTVLKMAQKRALVAAVLNGFGLSDRFTQDVEDLPHAEPVPTPSQASGNGQETGEVATDKQVAYLGRLLKSPVWTQEERIDYSERSETLTKAQMVTLINEVVAEGQRRKAAQAEFGDAAEPEAVA